MEVDAVVVGAGVIGLAIARELALQGLETVVLEAEKGPGAHTSSRNSEVIHAGMYYPTGSLKARFCVEGRARLYAYCAERGVPHKRLGKLIVANSDAEIAKLETLHKRGLANGVADLVWLEPREAASLEPEVVCRAALLSPSTGIVDSHALMLALQGDAEAAGAMFAFNTVVAGARRNAGGFEVLTGDPDEETLSCRWLVNAAGHGAHAVARGIEGYPVDALPPRYLAKGNYFSVSGRVPFTHLVYPMPVEGGLGVHVTLDMAGRMRLGPDLHWVEELDYAPTPGLEEVFRAAVRSYWPGIGDREIASSYCGVRPKISGPGQDNADFRIDGEAEHGVANLLCCFGWESPGLTSSLALAAHIGARISG